MLETLLALGGSEARDAALTGLAIAVVALVRVVWGLSSRVARLEALQETYPGRSRRGE